MKPLLTAMPGLQRQARRIDALTLRERAIMFVSIAVALVAAADHLVLSPRQAEQKTMATQMRQQARELDALRAQQATARADTPATRLVRELDTTRAEQRQVDEALARLQAGPGTGATLPDLLERVLRRHDRLTLLRLATIKPGAAAAAERAPSAVQITMRGSYPDLAQYVADTETALPGLRWGEVALLRQGNGAELSAQVFLVKATP